MDLNEVVVQLLLGLGSIGAVLVLVIFIIANHLAEVLQRKYQLKLDEEIEKQRTILSNKNYISKTKFDAEFCIYQNLSFAFSTCVKAINLLIPSGLHSVLADENDRNKSDKVLYLEANSAVANAQDELNKSIPFIPQEFCKDYFAILKLCGSQLYDFEQRWNVSSASNKDCCTLTHENYKRTREINQKFDELNIKIRDYLACLDVI